MEYEYDQPDFAAHHTWTTRDYRPNDAATLTALFRDAVRVTGATAYDAQTIAAWLAAADDEAAFAKKLADDWVRIAVDDDGKPVGFGAINLAGHIEMLYTAPEHGRQGVGSAVLQDLFFLAGAMGAKRISVEASRLAHAFFVQHGFTDGETTTVERGGVRIEQQGMSRSVPPLE